jgi:ClpP class serine protease
MRRGRFPLRRAPLTIDPKALDFFFDIPTSTQTPFTLVEDGKVAVVEIGSGMPMTQRPGWFFDSYEEIEQRVREAAASDARSIVLRIDSPGGDALGNFECARAIRSIAEKAGKPLYAFADGTAASAAYALACAAPTILVPPSALVGSIGCIMPIADMTAGDALYGIKFTLITSGSHKADGNPHQALTREAEAELQARVDGIAKLFYELVADFRPGVSVAHARGLEARLFLGAEAVTALLADGVKTWSETLALAAGGGPENQKETEMKIQAMDTEKKAAAMKAIRDAYGDDKDGAEKAIKSAFPDEEKKDEKDGEDKKEESKSKAKAEDEEKKEEAKAEEDQEKCLASAKAGNSAAILKIALSAQAENAKLRAEIEAKEEASARAELLAKRPDFTQDQRELLAIVSLSEVKKAVESWPRSGPMRISPAASLSAQGTKGASKQKGADEAVPDLSREDAAHIARKMGATVEGTGVIRRGAVLELGAMSPTQAQKYLADLEKADAEKGAA